MKTELIKTTKAAGRVLCHDITRIERGVFKGAAFKKGHIIREEDISVLLSLGKENIYSLTLEKGEVHEDEAGIRLGKALGSDGIIYKGPSEGKVELLSSIRGLVKVKQKALKELNMLPDVVIASLHSNFPVDEGAVLAGARVVPLVAKEDVVKDAEIICSHHRPVVSVKPYRSIIMGAVITGREVFEGRVKDAFAPVLKEKANSFGLPDPLITYAPDDAQSISNAIIDTLSRGAQLIVVTGGMSVDPDDVTPLGIRQSGALVEKYGAPVLPGAMFLLAYHNQVPVLGLPACGMFFRTTVFDLVFPRILAGERVTAEEIADLGYGGLCCQCKECRFPWCSFGKK